jgi:hypothetical protein
VRPRPDTEADTGAHTGPVPATVGDPPPEPDAHLQSDTGTDSDPHAVAVADSLAVTAVGV